MSKEKNIETLADVEADVRYTEVKYIDVRLDSNEIYYKLDDDDSYKYVCSFTDLVNNGIPDFGEYTILTNYFERELKKLKYDLEKYWNNKERGLYELKYNYKEGNPPYYIYLPFESDLVGDKKIEKTHNKKGEFVSDKIKENIDISVYGLDSSNLYLDINENSLSIYDVFLLNNIWDEYKRAVEISPRTEIEFSAGLYAYVLTLFTFGLSLYPIYLFLGFSSFISWFLIFYTFFPPFIQHIFTYKLGLLLISRIYVVYIMLTSKQYGAKKIIEI